MSIIDYQVKTIKKLCELIGAFALHFVDRTQKGQGMKWEPRDAYDEKAMAFMRARNVNGSDIFGMLPENWMMLDDIKKGSVPKQLAAVWIETSKDNYQCLMRFDRNLDKDERAHLKRHFKGDAGAQGRMFRIGGFINRKRAMKGEGDFMATMHVEPEGVQVIPADDLLKATRYVKPVPYVAPSVPAQKKKSGETIEDIFDRCRANQQDTSRADWAFVRELMNLGYGDEEIEQFGEDYDDPDSHNQRKGSGYWKTTVKNARRTWKPPVQPRRKAAEPIRLSRDKGGMTHER